MELEPPPPEQPPPPALKLSSELLHSIFIHLDSPKPFNTVCKAWHTASKDPYNVAHWALHRYERREAIYHVIRLQGKLCTAETLKILYSCGAIFSRYLADAIWTRCSQTSSNYGRHWLPSSWARSLNAKAFAWVVSTAADKWDDGVKLGEGGDSDEWDEWYEQLLAVREFNSGPMRLQQPLEDTVAAADGLEALWGLVQPRLVATQFVPFCPKDVRNEQVARAVCLEPRLFPMMLANGYEFGDATQDRLLRNLLCTTSPPWGLQDVCIHNNTPIIDSRSNIVSRDLKQLLERQPALRLRPNVAGEVLFGALLHKPESLSLYSDALTMLKVLEADGRLGYSLNDIARDLLRLMHNTQLSITQATHLLYAPHFHTASPAVMQLAFIASVEAVVERPTQGSMTGALKPEMRSGIDRSGNWSGFTKTFFDVLNRPLTRQVADILCSEFLFAPDYPLYFFAEHQDLDSTVAAELAAIRMIRKPSKGSTLLSLVAKYPFLVSRIRTEILSHRISLDLLTPSPDATDSTRPLYSHRPAFLSPIAFDYANAQLRYPLGLGPKPWVEGCYAPGQRAEKGRDDDYAESVWPVEPKKYYTGEGDERRADGFVNGAVLAETDAQRAEWGDGLRDWTLARVPQGSLPVAIALLDMFDKTDEALDIVLMHAILNLNASVTSFYLREGVPLRPHHLDALDRLRLPRMRCVEDHVTAQALKQQAEEQARLESGVVKNEHKRGGRKKRLAKLRKKERIAMDAAATVQANAA